MEEDVGNQDEEDMDQLLRSVTRRKRRPHKEVEGEALVDSQEEPDHTYMELLDRAYAQARAEGRQSAATTSQTKHSVPLPHISRMGRRTLWTNFAHTCRAVWRTPEEVLPFVLAELSTQCTLDSQANMVIRGRFLPSHLQTVLANYLKRNVVCPSCSSLQTDVVRDSTVRLQFLVCRVCTVRSPLARGS